MGNGMDNIGWFEISDAEGNRAALHPLATIALGSRVYSLMGAIRTNEAGENEGGLLLVRQNSMYLGADTKIEIVGDEREVEQVMSQVMSDLLGDENTAEFITVADEENPENECGHANGPREFCYCGIEELVQ